MAGFVAIVVSVLAFLVPLAVPLFVMRWRSYLVVLAIGVAFFTWLTLDLQRASVGDPVGEPNWIGPFLGGLMLFGFVAGAVAKFVMLLGRRRAADEPLSR